MNRLAVAAFEKYMLLDDTREFPMTCHIRLWFDGHFQREALQNAFAKAIDRHPLFKMLLTEPAERVSRGLHWLSIQQVPVPKIVWQPAVNPDAAPKGPNHLRPDQEIGVRLFVNETSTCSTVWVQFHHVHGDGAGMFFFLEDMFAYYDHFANGAALQLRAIDPLRLHLREYFGLDRISRITRIWKDLLRVGKFFKTAPVAIVSPDEDRYVTCGAIADLYANVRTELTAHQVARLKDYASRNGVTVNDVLLRDLFLTAKQWNEQLGVQGKIRVAMPIDLRVPEDAEMPCANVVSMCFIDHTPRAMRDPGQLLQRIHKETRYILDSRMGITLNRFLKWFGYAPKVLRRFLHNGQCKTSIVLTNIGRPFYGSRFCDGNGIFRVGQLTLTAIDSLPPVRHQTNFSISVNRYAGQLSITARYASNVFSAQQAAAFLESYRQQILAN